MDWFGGCVLVHVFSVPDRRFDINGFSAFVSADVTTYLPAWCFIMDTAGFVGVCLAAGREFW